MQVTAASLTGAFGRTAQYWTNGMLDEGCVHSLATVAHDTTPRLSIGRELATKRVGTREAEHLVVTRRSGIVKNLIPAELPVPGPVASQ
jgi:protein-tyrosine phosphatase